MAVIRFVGDVHLGKRPSHSTRASAQRHKDKVDQVLVMALGPNNKADLTIQLGDLFDSYTANNNEMVRASYIQRHTDILIKGNHDHAHNSYNVSALEDLSRLGPANSVGAEVVLAPQVFSYDREMPYYIHIVPYMPTQTDFIKALSELKPMEDGINILCLHTNMYAEGFNTSEVENNLTEITARELCHDFDLVISGHEHNGCVKHGVHMIGCLYPMTFGDMSDKYVLDFDTFTKEVTPVQVWTMDGAYEGDAGLAPIGAGYVRLDADEFLGVPEDHEYDFIEIYGQVQTTSILPLVKHMNFLLAESKVSSIKNGIKVIREVEEGDESPSVVSWESYVQANLNEDQFKLFLELCDE